MAGRTEAIALLILLMAAPVGLLGLLVGTRQLGLARHWPHRAAPAPAPRTLQDVSADVRRISAAFHRDGMRFAQYEGRRQAYDRVLCEAAAMLEVEHLLGVLPSGSELDHERRRVESVMASLGVLPHRLPGNGPRQP